MGLQFLIATWVFLHGSQAVSFDKLIFLNINSVVRCNCLIRVSWSFLILCKSRSSLCCTLRCQLSITTIFSFSPCITGRHWELYFPEFPVRGMLVSCGSSWISMMLPYTLLLSWNCIWYIVDTIWGLNITIIIKSGTLSRAFQMKIT